MQWLDDISLHAVPFAHLRCLRSVAARCVHCRKVWKKWGRRPSWMSEVSSWSSVRVHERVRMLLGLKSSIWNFPTEGGQVVSPDIMESYQKSFLFVFFFTFISISILAKGQRSRDKPFVMSQGAQITLASDQSRCYVSNGHWYSVRSVCLCRPTRTGASQASSGSALHKPTRLRDGNTWHVSANTAQRRRVQVEWASTCVSLTGEATNKERGGSRSAKADMYFINV